MEDPADAGLADDRIPANAALAAAAAAAAESLPMEAIGLFFIWRDFLVGCLFVLGCLSSHGSFVWAVACLSVVVL